ncbi:GTP-binding protein BRASSINAZOLE INSENSITIVE PALE GREEN 2, chloroplastic [Ricinus communis]|uniref:GTP-binding protein BRASSINAZOLE INSENSITIVE PALE GREEN 2, chloroplastic n=1 Tax=Ricinus communis TaxID=3988 RepID=UPI000772CC0B|nr:GTP-binding protein BRASSINAZOLE INSENSITIVE PALE GREEN 2, chloroplastic [Ricinus communis]|eukprot:XP_002530091.2 GTP-binding protein BRASSINAZOLE INSENSITIVE PALE GREEN 2, chloroplastic [Ricinus communis]
MAILLSTTAATKLSLKFLDNHGNRQEKSPTFHSIFTGWSIESKTENKRFSFVNFAIKNKTSIDLKQGSHSKIAPRKGGRDLVLSEGRDEDDKYGSICPGCGIFMQDKDPSLPGYYQKRKLTIESGEVVENEEMGFDDDFEGFEGEEEGFESGIEGKFEKSDGERDDFEEGDEFDWDSDEFEAMFEEDDSLDLDGFTPAGVGYGNITEEIIEKEKKKKEERKVSKAEKKRRAREAKKEKDEVTVCARCHSLRNYGQVKSQTAENLIPDFDFDKLISTRLIKPSSNANATVVIMVVDCVDFDGSFPKLAAMSLFKALEGTKNDPKTSKRLPKLVLVATKVDLLPSQISPARLDKWVRHRARAAGAPKLSGVYLVSSRKDLGVRNLLSFVKELAGPRGNVWVIGAQNAGKSTLINAFAKKEGAKISKLTEAPVPGTTLGILRIGGILSAKAKMYDTPGLLHPYLMSMRLNREEQKMVEIRKELQARTYRAKVGQAVHVGGLLRLDLNQASVETIYITVWASPSVSLHLGKMENANDFWKNHAGVRLQPPVGEDRASELGEWEEREIKVTGTSWDVNHIDIAIAGLGWFSLCLKGEATLTLWIYDGIQITLREPLVLDRASFLERPGFWLPKAISDTIGNQTKVESQKRKKLEQESMESLSEVSA